MEDETMPTQGNETLPQNEATPVPNDDIPEQSERINAQDEIREAPTNQTEQDAQLPPQKKNKHSKQESKKSVWLITYAAGSPDITVEMMHDHNVKCDEYYTISWRESKYTLIHLNHTNKIRRSTLTNTLKILHDKYGVKESFITGYEGIASNGEDMETSVQDHPGFKRMTEILNTNKEELKFWIESGDLLTYRKGLLWNFIHVDDPRKKTQKQLVMQVLEWTPIVQEAGNLRSQNEHLKLQLTAREEELESLYQKLTEKNKKILELMDRLRRAGLDCM